MVQPIKISSENYSKNPWNLNHGENSGRRARQVFCLPGPCDLWLRCLIRMASCGHYSISMIRKTCCVSSNHPGQQRAPLCPEKSIPFFFFISSTVFFIWWEINKINTHWMNKRINEETDLCKPTFFIFSVLNSVGHPMTAILCDPSVGAQNKKSVCNTSPKIQEARKKKRVQEIRNCILLFHARKYRRVIWIGMRSLGSSRILTSRLRLHFRWNLQEFCPACACCL